ncbi:tetratricopeptide (TPR) repeat protein [Parabacteroides sp. PFB2-12]|nr:tetratricopeptide (TPR) repeat protein [Parabacteroides sp. PM6-13]MDH6391215.1 tetratricopeptide (TPR) repeat protein [Parabacteroides sp. PFB2-12]
MEKRVDDLTRPTVTEKGLVRAWHEEVVIPTYEVGEAEKNPIFLEKRVYQGSSGVVYPYPVIESIADEKCDKTYQAVFLENEYIKVMILPELGGRVQMAYDKLKERHFIYYNQVVKPALVGLTGPWISGGIEFNWPQHHRPSTFMPVDYSIETFEDGSVTVWVSEMERMFHQKGMAGFTLRPGKAYLEVKGRLYNRTEVPQTFLWWANPAVAVNDYYQSVFPPDVNAVFDHGKRAVSDFPIATGTYYKVDYSAGVDISNYKNIPVPTSYMAINSRFNFVGGYENDTQAGVLHVANHHISPGKKQWTWGNGDFGRAWDRNLTDEDGPYIELMTGVYTDNQPDFTWLQPYEEKSFVQYFLPYRELGVVKNASRDLLMNIDPTADGRVCVKLFATSRQKVTICLKGESRIYFDQSATLSPEEVFEQVIDCAGEPFNQLHLSISAGGRELLSWHAEPEEARPIPDAAEAALLPHEIASTEQLYLTGLHLEQYRHATYNPVDYYEEALRREPSDVRNNNALGLWYLRKGRFAKAEPYFRAAVKTLLQRNPNPYDGEPFYNLGLALKYQGHYDEAYEKFYKSCWNGAWQDAGYFACAQISTRQGRLDDALEEVDRSLIRNWHNHQARHLKTTLLRRMGRTEEALQLIEDSLRIDRFNFGCIYERYIITQSVDELSAFHQLMRKEAHNYQEIALDYVAAGCWEEAVSILEAAIEVEAADPMTYYYMGYSRKQGGLKGMEEAFEQASKAVPDYCFPNRLEAILALQCAVEVNPADAKAYYYIGNLWYDKRQYDLAIEAWEASRQADDSFPTVWRNLALACFNKKQDAKRAIEYMERAFQLNPSDGRLLMELDQLYKRVGRPHTERLALLQQHEMLLMQRDDLYLERITLLNQTGEYAKAKSLLDARMFHPWEGGEGKVPAQYQIARVEMAKQQLQAARYEEALSLLEECLVYPPHLGEGKLFGAQENDFYYLMGCAYEGVGEAEKATRCWEKAVVGSTEPAAAIYYNDQKPDKIFYQGLALLKLHRPEEAETRFRKLIAYGEKHLADQIRIDYFAVSLPDLLIWEDDLNLRNVIHCRYMMSLGYGGLGEMDKALPLLEEVEKLDINHQGIQAFRSLIPLLITHSFTNKQL